MVHFQFSLFYLLVSIYRNHLHVDGLLNKRSLSLLPKAKNTLAIQLHDGPKTTDEIVKKSLPEPSVSAFTGFNSNTEYHQDGSHGTEPTLDQLIKEREKRRLQFVAADLAIRQYNDQIAQAKLNSTDIIRLKDDYGFTIKAQFIDVGGDAVPRSALKLALANFERELRNIWDTLIHRDTVESLNFDEGQAKLRQLTLSNDAVWKREAMRPEIEAPWIIKIPYYALCLLLDTLFDKKPISRFYFLETVARMPYFSYITALHAYETLGWWRRSTEAKRVHFAEEYNELHHLLIMESLGGDQNWEVRFFAQHSAIVYFFVLIFLWLASPTLAYNFSELIEAHAVDTYAEFADANKELLESMAAPAVAKQYYESPDLYIFDEFQTSQPRGTRRPRVVTLYDVFCNIRDDEKEHVKTMAQCQDPQALLQSPNTEAGLAAAALAFAVIAFAAGDSIALNFDEILTSFTQQQAVISEAASQAGLEGNTEVIEGGVEATKQGAAVFTDGVMSRILNILSKFI